MIEGLLVAQFAACVVEDVCGLEGWSVLFHDVPDFVADFPHPSSVLSSIHFLAH